MSETTPTTTTPVNWGAMIAGLFLAGFLGCFIGLASFWLGMLARGSGAPKIIGFAVGFGGPIVVFGAAYLLGRNRFRDFCRGMLVGACIVVLITGACSSIILAT